MIPDPVAVIGKLKRGQSLMVVRAAGRWVIGAGMMAGWLAIAGDRPVIPGESRAKVAVISSLVSAPD